MTRLFLARVPNRQRKRNLDAGRAERLVGESAGVGEELVKAAFPAFENAAGR